MQLFVIGNIMCTLFKLQNSGCAGIFPFSFGFDDSI
jgi:hypothetical protein